MMLRLFSGRIPRKTILVRMLAALLLAGLSACGGTPSSQNDTESREAESTVIDQSETDDEVAAQSEAEVTLSSLFQPADEDAVLLAYEGKELDAMEYPELMLFQDMVLLWSTDYSESEIGTMTLTLLDPSTCEITAETTVICDCILAPQAVDDALFLCDSGTGLILRFDEALEVTGSWQLEGDYAAWYMGTDGTTLYHVVDDSTLLATDLNSAESEVLIADAVELYMSVSNSSGTDIYLVDGETQLSSDLWLSFDTGELCEPPFGGTYTWISCQDGFWLTTSYQNGTVQYCVGTEASAWSTELDDGSLTQVEGCTRLLWEDGTSDTLILYDGDGTFVSSCTLPKEDIWYSSGCFWSDVYQGIFLLTYDADGVTLLFWDIDAETSGEDLSTTALSDESITAGSAVDAALYERAEDLSETYGVEIRIADLCETVYESFTVKQATEESLISAGLDAVEEVLSVYPDGFFDQLQFASIRGIQINLMGTMTPTDENWGDGSYSGFTQEDGSTYVMVIDLYQLEIGSFYHEFSHIIDSKLEWDAYCREDALFSEEAWSELNPYGFEYELVYDGWWDWNFEGEEWAYFIDTYSMISPTEDRARVMEYALNGQTWMITDYEPILAKLTYYCACIRDAFDTAGWPEVTAWEQALAE